MNMSTVTRKKIQNCHQSVNIFFICTCIINQISRVKKNKILPCLQVKWNAAHSHNKPQETFAKNCGRKNDEMMKSSIADKKELAFVNKN